MLVATIGLRWPPPRSGRMANHDGEAFGGDGRAMSGVGIRAAGYLLGDADGAVSVGGRSS